MFRKLSSEFHHIISFGIRTATSHLRAENSFLALLDEWCQKKILLALQKTKLYSSWYNLHHCLARKNQRIHNNHPLSGYSFYTFYCSIPCKPSLFLSHFWHRELALAHIEHLLTQIHQCKMNNCWGRSMWRINQDIHRRLQGLNQILQQKNIYYSLPHSLKYSKRIY